MRALVGGIIGVIIMTIVITLVQQSVPPSDVPNTPLYTAQTAGGGNLTNVPTCIPEISRKWCFCDILGVNQGGTLPDGSPETTDTGVPATTDVYCCAKYEEEVTRWVKTITDSYWDPVGNATILALQALNGALATFISTIGSGQPETWFTSEGQRDISTDSVWSQVTSILTPVFPSFNLPIPTGPRCPKVHCDTCNGIIYEAAGRSNPYASSAPTASSAGSIGPGGPASSAPSGSSGSSGPRSSAGGSIASVPGTGGSSSSTGQGSRSSGGSASGASSSEPGEWTCCFLNPDFSTDCATLPINLFSQVQTPSDSLIAQVTGRRPLNCLPGRTCGCPAQCCRTKTVDDPFLGTVTVTPQCSNETQIACTTTRDSDIGGDFTTTTFGSFIADGCRTSVDTDGNLPNCFVTSAGSSSQAQSSSQRGVTPGVSSQSSAGSSRARSASSTNVGKCCRVNCRTASQIIPPHCIPSTREECGQTSSDNWLNNPTLPYFCPAGIFSTDPSCAGTPCRPDGSSSVSVAPSSRSRGSTSSLPGSSAQSSSLGFACCIYSESEVASLMPGAICSTMYPQTACASLVGQWTFLPGEDAMAHVLATQWVVGTQCPAAIARNCGYTGSRSSSSAVNYCCRPSPSGSPPPGETAHCQVNPTPGSNCVVPSRDGNTVPFSVLSACETTCAPEVYCCNPLSNSCSAVTPSFGGGSSSGTCPAGYLPTTYSDPTMCADSCRSVYCCRNTSSAGACTETTAVQCAPPSGYRFEHLPANAQACRDFCSPGSSRSSASSERFVACCNNTFTPASLTCSITRESECVSPDWDYPVDQMGRCDMICAQRCCTYYAGTHGLCTRRDPTACLNQSPAPLASLWTPTAAECTTAAGGRCGFVGSSASSASMSGVCRVKFSPPPPGGRFQTDILSDPSCPLYGSPAADERDYPTTSCLSCEVKYCCGLSPHKEWIYGGVPPSTGWTCPNGPADGTLGSALTECVGGSASSSSSAGVCRVTVTAAPVDPRWQTPDYTDPVCPVGGPPRADQRDITTESCTSCEVKYCCGLNPHHDWIFAGVPPLEGWTCPNGPVSGTKANAESECIGGSTSSSNSSTSGYYCKLSKSNPDPADCVYTSADCLAYSGTIPPPNTRTSGNCPQVLYSPWSHDTNICDLDCNIVYCCANNRVYSGLVSQLQYSGRCAEFADATHDPTVYMSYADALNSPVCAGLASAGSSSSANYYCAFPKRLNADGTRAGNVVAEVFRNGLSFSTLDVPPPVGGQIPLCSSMNDGDPLYDFVEMTQPQCTTTCQRAYCCRPTFNDGIHLGTVTSGPVYALTRDASGQPTCGGSVPTVFTSKEDAIFACVTAMPPGSSSSTRDSAGSSSSTSAGYYCAFPKRRNADGTRADPRIAEVYQNGLNITWVDIPPPAGGLTPICSSMNDGDPLYDFTLMPQPLCTATCQRAYCCAPVLNDGMHKGTVLTGPVYALARDPVTNQPTCGGAVPTVFSSKEDAALACGGYTGSSSTGSTGSTDSGGSSEGLAGSESSGSSSSGQAYFVLCDPRPVTMYCRVCDPRINYASEAQFACGTAITASECEWEGLDLSTAVDNIPGSVFATPDGCMNFVCPSGTGRIEEPGFLRSLFANIVNILASLIGIDTEEPEPIIQREPPPKVIKEPKTYNNLIP